MIKVIENFNISIIEDCKITEIVKGALYRIDAVD